MMTSLALARHPIRHPIRRAFPPPVLAAIPRERPRGEDVRLFLMTFVAGLLAISGLIA